jgi:RHS repeat-associated protein
VRISKSFSKLALSLACSFFLPQLVHGQGNEAPNGVAGGYNGIITSGGSHDPFTGNAKRAITDIAVPGSVGTYPLTWTRFSNTRSMRKFFGGGGSWSHNYTYDLAIFAPPNIPPHWEPEPWNGPWANVVLPDGQSINFWEEITTNGAYANGLSADGVLLFLKKIGTGIYFLQLPDGGMVHFYKTAVIELGQTVYYNLAKEIVDPYGQVTTLTYDTSAKLTKVTEPGGRYLQISYVSLSTVNSLGDTSYSDFIASVQANDGRGNILETVTYTYTEQRIYDNQSYPTLRALTQATYSDGTFATYTYANSNASSPARVLTRCDDPRFAGPMKRIEYEYMTGAANVVAWGQIKSEKNLTTHQFVSRITYPVYDTQHPENPVNFFRTETRGDGATRTFQFPMPPGVGSLAIFNPPSGDITYTDFKNQPTTVIDGFDGTHVTDARGKVTIYKRTNINVLEEIDYPGPGNPKVSFTHSNSNTAYPDIYLASRTDERGHTTNHTRDANNRITRTDYPPDEDSVRPYETFEYTPVLSLSSFGQLKKHRLTNGAYEHFQYDTRGLLLKKWSPTWHATALEEDDKTIYTYYASGPWIDRVESETDPRGNVVFYEYDHAFSGEQMTTTPCAGRGLVTKIRFPNDTHSGAYPNGTSRSFGFDKWGDKVWEENEKAERTNYTYDDYRRVLTVEDPLHHFTTYTYKPTSGTNPDASVLTANVPDTITSATNVVTKNVYDENLRKTSTIQGSGTTPPTTTFEYDEVGNLTKVKDPLNHETKTTYDDRNRKHTVEDALHHFTTLNYDDASNVTSIARPDATTETKTYDNLNRVLTDTVPTNGIAANDLTTRWKYNPSGTIASVTDPKNQITTFEYDAAGSKTKMTYPNATNRQEWTYDGNKNLVARRTVNGAVQNFGYDARNRKENMLWTSDGSAPNFTADWANFRYDGAGRLTDASNATSSIVRDYDAAGRLNFDKQILPPPSPVMPVTVVSRKTHSAAGNFDISLPLSGTVAVEPRTGANGHKIVLTFAHAILHGGVSVTPNTIQVSHTLSADGTQVTLDLSGVADAQTIVVTLADVTDGTVVNNVSVGMAVLLGDVSCNRMVTGSDKNLCKAQVGVEVSASNFLCDVNLTGSITGGDVNAISAQTGAELPAANPLAQTPPDNRQVYVRYEYDNDGKQKRLSVDGAEYDRTFLYDAIGRFEKIKNTVGGGDLFQYVYDAASNETERQNLLNGVHQIYTRDWLNRMQQRDVKKGTSTLSTEAYGFDVMSRLTSVNREDNKRDAFAYDYSSQLTSANYGLTYNGTTWVNPVRPVSYVWDKAGNRDHVVDNGQTSNYTTTILNQYIMAGANAVTNGSEHEIANYQGNNYGYVNDERLASINSPSTSDTYQLTYDALGRCVKRTLNGVITYYVYDGEKPIVEYNNVYQRLAVNIYGKAIDEILARTDYSVNPIVSYYYQDDHEGSVTHLTDGSGNVIESYRYDAFGAPAIFNLSGIPVPVSGFNNRFMFTGREYAQTFGIYEYRNRAYHPSLGRFMSEDPIGFQIAGDKPSEALRVMFPTLPESFQDSEFNLYRYCHNDPVNKIDPMGLIDEGHMEPDALEGAVQGSKKLLQYVGHEIAEEYREQGPLRFAVNVGMMLSRGPKVEGGPHLPGFKPPLGIRVRPEGIPQNWRIRPTEGQGGTEYYNPRNPNESVRVMPGNRNSPHANSQQPYVRQRDSSGSYLDANGKRGDPNSAETHIPLQDYKFRR